MKVVVLRYSVAIEVWLGQIALVEMVDVQLGEEGVVTGGPLAARVIVGVLIDALEVLQTIRVAVAIAFVHVVKMLGN